MINSNKSDHGKKKVDINYQFKNETKDITTNSTDIIRIIKKINAYKFKTGEMDTFLERHNLSMLTQE